MNVCKEEKGDRWKLSLWWVWSASIRNRSKLVGTWGIRYVVSFDPKIIYSSIFGSVNKTSPIKLTKNAVLSGLLFEYLNPKQRTRCSFPEMLNSQISYSLPTHAAQIICESLREFIIAMYLLIWSVLYESPNEIKSETGQFLSDLYMQIFFQPGRD